MVSTVVPFARSRNVCVGCRNSMQTQQSPKLVANKRNRSACASVPPSKSSRSEKAHCDGMLADWGKAAVAASAAVALVLGNPTDALAKDFQMGGDQLFDAMSYVGRWYEVASLKKGFAGEGQQDCHCTQGIYMPRRESDESIKIQVNTFCIHGGPNGRISGIQGQVTCANPKLLQLLPEFETSFERKEMIKEKCVLRFPSIPFIPPEPYDIIRTDYETYALVQGATDTGFVQIYSRVPNPGKEFIEEQKATLKELGYPAEQVVDTPQDCPEIPVANLMSMMKSDSSMEVMMTNTMASPIDPSKFTSPMFAGPRNVLESIKDVFGIFSQDGN